jgi:hypothetical protein
VVDRRRAGGLLAEKVAALGDPLGLPAAGRVDRAAAAVLDRLARSQGWLVVFDDATTADDVRRWLPAGPGQVLITSRHPAWGEVATRIDVDVLSRREAVTLLRTRVPGMNPDVAGELAAELGDLPLALGQAAAYLERTEARPETYLQRFRARREQMVAKGADLTYGGSLDTAWSVALDRIRTETPETAQMLEIAAFCAPEPIPLALFTAHPELLPHPLSEAAGGRTPESDVDDVVAAALAYSLCRH